jgi:hypothetical protein
MKALLSLIAALLLGILIGKLVFEVPTVEKERLFFEGAKAGYAIGVKKSSTFVHQVCARGGELIFKHQGKIYKYTCKSKRLLATVTRS